MKLSNNDITDFVKVSEALKGAAKQLDIAIEILKKECEGKLQDGDEEKLESALGIYMMKMLSINEINKAL